MAHPKRGLRQVDFVFDGNEIRGLEQNPETKSRWAQLAGSGKRVTPGSGEGLPSFGRGFDSHRPLHKPRWINWLYPAELPESDAKMDRFGLKMD
jgi:hypothetical protein